MKTAFPATVAVLFFTICGLIVLIGETSLARERAEERAAVDAVHVTGIIPKDGRNWCADPDRDKSQKCIGPSRAEMETIKCKTLSSEVQHLCNLMGYDSVVANKDGWVQKRLARDKARSQQWVDEYNMILVLNRMGANLPLPSIWRR